jgi:glycosyltransferase involved in cell wall biosynthesis
MVSCIMPTANRERFARQAIRYFERQDYPNCELIVVDDGAASIEKIVAPDHPGIRYLRLPQRRRIGTKRNIAVEAARGELIAHWDDDDWMAPDRLARQVGALLDSDADICGLRDLYFYDCQAGRLWLYTYPRDQRFWLAGGSLLYRKSLWARCRFPDAQIGEDALFLWRMPRPRSVTMDDNRFYVATIHANNTAPKLRRPPAWSAMDHLDAASLFGDDLPFYRGRPTVRLNLGCCDAPLPGFVNVDIFDGPGVDQVADLARTWPWSDDSVESVRAHDVIEHLPDKIQTMNELWRVLQPGGTAEIVVPTTDGTGAFQDPTHLSFWNRRSFLYYEAGNPYRERFMRHYGIRAKFRIVREHTQGSMDGPRLTIVLEAVKP